MYKIALVGCGEMAKEWARYTAQREDCKIVALVDISEEHARKFKEMQKLDCDIFTDLERALAKTGADLVFDVTIPASHRKIAATALNAGCNVLGEKPMASSMKEARELVEIAEKTGKSYAVMQNRRFLKNIRAYGHLIRSGAIGTVGTVCTDFFSAPHFGGFREEMDSPLILDMAIHPFDAARYITGTDPISVYCHEFNPTGSWYRGNANADCIFEMSDGSVFNFRGSWCANGFSTSAESNWRVIGSEGTAIWDGFEKPFYEVRIPAKEKVFTEDCKREEAPLIWNGRDGHFGCLDEMFHALKEGRKAETDCTDNIKSVAMVFGAIESAKTGKKVNLKDWY